MGLLYSTKPVVDDIELERSIKEEYGIDLTIIPLLFGDYSMDLYREFYFDKQEYYIYPEWQNLEEVNWRNIVRKHLQKYFPGQTSVLIRESDNYDV